MIFQGVLHEAKRKCKPVDSEPLSIIRNESQASWCMNDDHMHVISRSCCTTAYFISQKGLLEEWIEVRGGDGHGNFHHLCTTTGYRFFFLLLPLEIWYGSDQLMLEKGGTISQIMTDGGGICGTMQQTDEFLAERQVLNTNCFWVRFEG